MMHSVGGKMNDHAAQRLLGGWGVERVQKRLVEAILVSDDTGEPEELR